jgi:hypothetical protein
MRYAILVVGGFYAHTETKAGIRWLQSFVGLELAIVVLVDIRLIRSYICELSDSDRKFLGTDGYERHR